jgi:hypothetical protein
MVGCLGSSLFFTIRTSRSSPPAPSSHSVSRRVSLVSFICEMPSLHVTVDFRTGAHIKYKKSNPTLDVHSCDVSADVFGAVGAPALVVRAARLTDRRRGMTQADPLDTDSRHAAEGGPAAGTVAAHQIRAETASHGTQFPNQSMVNEARFAHAALSPAGTIVRRGHRG